MQRGRRTLAKPSEMTTGGSHKVGQALARKSLPARPQQRRECRPDGGDCRGKGSPAQTSWKLHLCTRGLTAPHSACQAGPMLTKQKGYTHSHVHTHMHTPLHTYHVTHMNTSQNAHITHIYTQHTHTHTAHMHTSQNAHITNITHMHTPHTATHHTHAHTYTHHTCTSQIHAVTNNTHANTYMHNTCTPYTHSGM